MNIIKGLDRIALVIAILVIVPGFMVGYSAHQEIKKTLTPQYQEWSKKYGFDAVFCFIFRRIFPNIKYHPPMYNYPPVWISVLCGMLSAPISFVVVLFGLRGMNRGIKWFSLWLIEGFKDDKKE